MKRFNLVVFGVNLAFHACLIGFSFYAVAVYDKQEKNLENLSLLTRGTEMEELLRLSNLIPESIWIFTSGSVLFILLSLLFWLENHRLKKQVQASRNLQNEYKAQMYDLQKRVKEVEETQKGPHIN